MTDLHGIDVDDFLHDCVSIEPTEIEEEFVRVPAELAYWSHRYAESYERRVRAKLQLDRVAAMLRLKHRSIMEDEKVKITESQVDARVETDDEMFAAREAMLRAEVDEVRTKGAVEAVRAKRDMLVSIGAHQRAEMQGDPLIRREARDARARISDE